jgi:hypothetical protein
MKRIIVSMMAAALLAAAATGAFAAATGSLPGAKPRVEVAFVLDSTGSMGGLIEGAKQKIWAIANSIIARKPTPEVRIGLLSYRDRGDEYVTRMFDLTDDIDTVFRNLQSFVADGGGDDEESVNQALAEAVSRMGWSRDRQVLKIIFLVGDYPPHMNYAETRYPETCRAAVKADIIINTVQCGDVSETARVWRDIARLSEGAYVALEQSGGMVAISSPYDDEIAATSSRIASTVVVYGEREMQAESRSKMEKAAAAPASVAADRAAYNLASGGKAIQGSGDLVEDIRSGTVDLSKVAKDKLPAEMQKMSAKEQAQYVASRQAERDGLNAHMEELSRLRAAWIEAEQKKLAAQGGGDSFDARVAQIIAEQAARKLKKG